jgi:hypothetical protein
MIEYDDKGAPIPDGWIHITTVHPRDHWVKHIRGASPMELPGAITEDDYITNAYEHRYFFKNIHGWDRDGGSDGVRIRWEHGYTVFPEYNIQSFDIRFNSDEYRAALCDWVVKCDHVWEEVPAPTYPATTTKQCTKCAYPEYQIKQYEEQWAKRQQELLQEDA